MQNQPLSLTPAGVRRAEAAIELFEVLLLRKDAAEMKPFVDLLRTAVTNAEVKQPPKAPILRLIINGDTR